MCEWCGSKENLQCAHIFTRTYNSTRYNPLNAVCLCAKCHFRWHQEPVEAVEWVKHYLGEEVYDELRREAKVRIEKKSASFYRTVIEKIQAGESPYER